MGSLRLSEIWIYPIKSLGGIRLKSSKVLEKGLLHDRRWMLVDEKGNFMTQRTHPAMALLKLSFGVDRLNIHHANSSMSVLPGQPHKGTAITTHVFDDPVTVFEVSDIHSAWVSERLNLKCRLVYFPEENRRPVDPDYRVNREQVSLADAFPFLIIGENSLSDLNNRLKDPLPMNRFRPNLVFSGGVAYEEDTWKNFKVGRNRFVGVKPCARCVVTTVNQDTAQKGIEPLATLATYRRRNGNVYFGQNAIAIDHEEIVEGDEIIVG
jgi:uncharacterized protein YcbX